MDNRKNLIKALEDFKNTKYQQGVYEVIYWTGKVAAEGSGKLYKRKEEVPVDPAPPITIKKFCSELIQEGESYLMPNNINDLFRREKDFFNETFIQDGKCSPVLVFKEKLIKKLINYFEEKKSHAETQEKLKNYLKNLQEGKNGQANS